MIMRRHLFCKVSRIIIIGFFVPYYIRRQRYILIKGVLTMCNIILLKANLRDVESDQISKLLVVFLFLHVQCARSN